MSTPGHAESPDGLRRERAAIAAQACQTCRNRKSKCDEQRPKCGLCKRLGVDCQYREPQPTKKDKTMVHILDALQRLEARFDSLITSAVAPAPTPSSSHESITQTEPLPLPYGLPQRQGKSDKDKARAAEQYFPKGLQRSYHHLTAAHKIILWPAVYLRIVHSSAPAAADLNSVLHDGTHWFINLELHKHPLTLPCQSERFSLLSNGMPGRDERSGFPPLTVIDIRRLTDAYFNKFNVIHPILNRSSFEETTLQPMLHNGYQNGDSSACVVLLVLALGQVAIDGVYGQPVSFSKDGTPSGLRGGTVERPPGLEIFNEARRRIGWVMNLCTLENVQIFLLQAMYYEADARHMDFWRSTVAASLSCQVFIRCEPIEWESHQGDLVKRAFWTCILSEDLYHLELDLPQTGILSLEDQVPLPHFDEARRSSPSDDKSHFQYHFLAMIALRRLITRIHSSIHGSSNSAELSEDYGGPPVHVIKELARQLESWRSLLPKSLQWSDSDKLDFPDKTNAAARRSAPDTLFGLDQGAIPVEHEHNLDIITGQLRTRFYYARFMMYRPFVYKALHFPELMTVQDADCCALALQSACLWPLALAPCRNKKRLVPHLFTWTQNFIGILLILRMTADNECLRLVCEEMVNKAEIERTVALLLDWIRDVKQVDGIAEWGWKLLEGVYTVKPFYISPGQ